MAKHTFIFELQYGFPDTDAFFYSSGPVSLPVLTIAQSALGQPYHRTSVSVSEGSRRTPIGPYLELQPTQLEQLTAQMNGQPAEVVQREPPSVVSPVECYGHASHAG